MPMHIAMRTWNQSFLIRGWREDVMTGLCPVGKERATSPVARLQSQSAYDQGLLLTLLALPSGCGRASAEKIDSSSGSFASVRGPVPPKLLLAAWNDF